MIRKILLSLLILIAATSAAEAAEEQKSEPTFKERAANLAEIQAIRVGYGSGTVRIVTDITKKVEFKESYVENPSRIIIDLKNAWLNPQVQKEMELKSLAAKKLRVAQFDSTTVRIVIESMADIRPFFVSGGAAGWRFVIDIGNAEFKENPELNKPEQPVKENPEPNKPEQPVKENPEPNKPEQPVKENHELNKPEQPVKENHEPNKPEQPVKENPELNKPEQPVKENPSNVETENDVLKQQQERELELQRREQELEQREREFKEQQEREQRERELKEQQEREKELERRERELEQREREFKEKQERELKEQREKELKKEQERKIKEQREREKELKKEQERKIKEQREREKELKKNKDKEKEDVTVEEPFKGLEDDLGGLMTLQGKKIAIDPGHGGNDAGAIGPTGVMEKDVTLRVALELRKLLEAEGAQVIMTRDTDRTVSEKGAKASDIEELGARCDVGNKAGADIFISIHADSFTRPEARGTTGYYYGKSTTGRGQKLADCIRRNLVEQLGTPSRGTQPCNFYVVKNTDMPATLIELGFISNKEEEKLLDSKEGIQKAAHGIFDGIEDYFG